MESICKIKNIYNIFYGFEKDFFKKNGMTLNESIILYSLAGKESCSAGDLSSSIGLTNSRASRIIIGVEEKGYVIRKMGKADKRQVFFTLTNSGKQKLAEIQNLENEYRNFITSLIEHIKKEFCFYTA